MENKIRDREKHNKLPSNWKESQVMTILPLRRDKGRSFRRTE